MWLAGLPWDAVPVKWAVWLAGLPWDAVPVKWAVWLAGLPWDAVPVKWAVWLAGLPWDAVPVKWALWLAGLPWGAVPVKWAVWLAGLPWDAVPVKWAVWLAGLPWDSVPVKWALWLAELPWDSVPVKWALWLAGVPCDLVPVKRALWLAVSLGICFLSMGSSIVICRSFGSWSFTAEWIDFAFCPFFLVVRHMAAAWKSVLDAAMVPEAASTKLVALGYGTQEAFQFEDAETFKAFAKHFLLQHLKPEGVTADTWSFHPMVGVLRALWLKVKRPDSNAASAPDTSLSLAVPAFSGGLAGALVGHGKGNTVADRDVMRRKLEQKCSGSLITLASLPSMALLSRVKAQQESKAWEWISWKKLLSEKAVTAVKGRRKAGPQDSFMEALACGAGFFEEQYDKEISGAPFQVQALLQVRAHAYSMVNASHLGSWALYNTHFMEYYTQECGDHYRFLTAAEAEEADQLALREVFGLCYSGASLDDALSTVAVDRDMLRHVLMLRPKVPRVAAEKEPLKRKARRQADDAFKGECFAWRQGKCQRKDCKYSADLLLIMPLSAPRMAPKAAANVGSSLD